MLTPKQVKTRKAQHEADVLAHIAGHRDKGETAAVEAHMESPEHRAIIEAAESTAKPTARPKAKRKAKRSKKKGG